MSDALAHELERLCARAERGVCLGLERMVDACARLGHPERRFSVVHVAGTNGKGSTSAMLERILRESGKRTGLYTSPHLARFAERIRIDGEPIDDAAFAAALATACSKEVGEPSLFEALTLAAFIAFARAEVDVAVLEVGLGGRLDATNVVPFPLACAVTSIGLDHTRILGPDHASIACEKAGIAKPGSPLVVGPLPSDAVEATRRTATERGARSITWVVEPESTSVPPSALRSELTCIKDEARVTLPDGATYTLRPQLPGRHQLANAAVAATVAHALRPHITGIERAVERGIAEARWPGRLESLSTSGREVLLDCAHNAEGIATLCAYLRAGAPERTVLVYGAVEDKPWQPMLAALAPHATRRHYGRALEAVAGRRAVEPAELAAYRPGRAHASIDAALDAALDDAGPEDRLVVTGSIFLVGAVRARLLGMTRDRVIPM